MLRMMRIRGSQISHCLKGFKTWKEERLGRTLRSWTGITSIGLISWVFKNTHTQIDVEIVTDVCTHMTSSSSGHTE